MPLLRGSQKPTKVCYERSVLVLGSLSSTDYCGPGTVRHDLDSRRNSDC